MNRRNFIVSASAAAATAAFAKPFAHPIGLNLYTVRTPLAKAPAETYRALGKIGVQILEVRPAQLQQHASMIRDAGLKPVHMFIESASITGAWDEWRGFMTGMAAKMKMPAPPANGPKPTLEEMLELAKRHGVQRIGTSMLLPGERASAIERINAAAEKCAAAGVELYYHNHAFEFAGPKGSRFIDQLHARLDPRVRLELDIFWASVGGDNPAAVLKRWKGRVRSMHLKDVAPDAPRNPKEVEVPPSAFRELGKGTLDIKSILTAARKAGVEHYFIELDYSPGDPIESVRAGVEYLRGISV